MKEKWMIKLSRGFFFLFYLKEKKKNEKEEVPTKKPLFYFIL